MKVKFTYGFISHQGDYSEIHEVADDSTDENLQQILDGIVNDQLDAYFERVEDEG
jgi:hypothetical protein